MEQSTTHAHRHRHTGQFALTAFALALYVLCGADYYDYYYIFKMYYTLRLRLWEFLSFFFFYFSKNKSFRSSTFCVAVVVVVVVVDSVELSVARFCVFELCVVEMLRFGESYRADSHTVNNNKRNAITENEWKKNNRQDTEQRVWTRRRKWNKQESTRSISLAT